MRVAEASGAVGLRTSLRIVLEGQLVGIPPQIQHPIEKMRSRDDEHAAARRAPIQNVGGQWGPTPGCSELMRETPNRTEVACVQQLLQQQGARTESRRVTDRDDPMR